MSKLTKNDLKDIVKECLVEILAEGLGGNRSSLKEEISKKKKRKSAAKKTLHGYSPPTEYGEIPQVHARKDNPINTNITTNSILNEMLADTAQSTLKEQLAADSSRGRMAYSPSQGDQATKIMAKTDPVDMFGEAVASKWSQLAFSDNK
jgi:hypothetical protein